MTAAISLIFWLVAIPFCMGLIPAYFTAPGRRSLGFLFLAGCFGMWALFGLTAIPAALFVKYDNFKVASAFFAAFALLFSAAGLLLWYRNRVRGGASLLTGKGREKGNDISVTNGRDDENGGGVFGDMRVRIKKKGAARFWGGGWRRNLSERVSWVLFFALLGFQIYKAAAYASFDGDDAYYVVESLIAQEAGVMYRILPYTGGSTDLDVRHVLAVFPMWVAFVAVRAGLHATIVSHLILPLFLIPLTYLLYYEVGKALFSGEERGRLPVFLALLCLFQIFGNVSIYTNETFLLTRTWQGKAVAGALVIPALFWLFLIMRRGRREGEPGNPGLWLLFVCVNLTAGICSSMAVFLLSLLTAVTAFSLAAAERDIRLLLKYGAACVPNLVYMGIYVFLPAIL